MKLDSDIFVAGHKGMVGSAIVRALTAAGYGNVLTADKSALDLRDPTQVDRWFGRNKPAYVFLAAAKVGGIVANRDHKGQFIYDNLMIQTNVIHAAHTPIGAGNYCSSALHAFIPSVPIFPSKESSLTDRAAGANQRRLRCGQDCRHHDVSGLSSAVRIQLPSP